MQAALPETLKLLADPTRLRLLTLVGQAELAVQELVAITGMPQSRVSNHLAILKRAGFVSDRREGSWSFYSLTAPSDAGPLTPALHAAVLAPFATTLDGQRDSAQLEVVRERRREKSRAAHDALADRWVDVGQEFRTGAVRAEAFAAATREDWVAADLGCGAGYLTGYLAERASRVVAVDHSGKMLREAKQRLVDAPELSGAVVNRVEFRCGELDALPLEDSEVHAAFMHLVWHHLPDAAAVARELYRIVRPGGQVVVSDLAPHQEEWMREAMGDLRLGSESAQITAALQSAGFTELQHAPSTDAYLIERPNGERAELNLFVVRGRKPAAA